MSTRKRTSSADSSSTAANLPPPRQTKALRKVRPPLINTRLPKVIYILAILTTILGAFYTYRVVQYKAEVGGWWNLALGKRPPQLYTQDRTETKKEPKNKHEESVEDKINALAKALGMPSSELASAIAGAVKMHVPPASLSSVAAKETGPAVEALLHGTEDHSHNARATPPATPGVVGGIVSGMEGFVGMDEP